MQAERRPLAEGHCHTLRGMTVVRHRFVIDGERAPGPERPWSGRPGLTIDGVAGVERREVTELVHAAVSSVARWKDRGIYVRIEQTRTRGRNELLIVQLALAILRCDAPVVAGVDLDGQLKPIAGALLYAEALRAAGAPHLLCAAANADEVALAGLPVFVVERLADCLKDTARLARVSTGNSGPDDALTSLSAPDLRDITSPEARRVLELAAAGGHPLLLCGPPGGETTMLARRLPTILPAPTWDESLAMTRARSAAGLQIPAATASPGASSPASRATSGPSALVVHRPFRAPHFSLGIAGLLGGGSPHPRPGELTLASEGVLFLDDLTEFHGGVLATLREPIATGEIVFHRADGTIELPARVHLVAAMSPCPCGRGGASGGPACRCTNSDVRHHRGRIKNVDALFDLRASLPPVELRARDVASATRASSETVRARVTACRAVQQQRQQKQNAKLGPLDIDKHAPLKGALWASFGGALDAHGMLSVRRVARTIADLEGSSSIESVHLNEALQWSRRAL